MEANPLLVSICSILIPAVLLGAIVTIVLLLVSLARQGDERRRMIRDRACICTFYISLGVLIADTLRSAILVYVDGMESNTLHPFVLLTIIALVFAVALAVFKRKYGG